MARSTPALLLLAVLAALVGPSLAVPAAKSVVCPAAQASAIAAAATCGCESAFSRCLSTEAPGVIDLAVLQTCLVKAGCSEGKAGLEAMSLLSQCCGGGRSDLRRRREEVGSAGHPASAVAAVKKRADPKDSKDGGKTTQDDKATVAKDSKPTPTTPPKTTTNPSNARPTDGPTSDSASDSSTSLVCSVTKLITTTACTDRAGKNTCFPTVVPTVTCAPGLLCQANDQGVAACKVAAKFGVSGIVLATVMGTFTAGCIVGLFYCCIEDYLKSKRIAKREAEALLAAKTDAELEEKQARKAAKAAKAGHAASVKDRGITEPLVWGGSEKYTAAGHVSHRIDAPVPPYTPMDPDVMMQLHAPAPPYATDVRYPAAGQGGLAPAPLHVPSMQFTPAGNNGRVPIAQPTALRPPPPQQQQSRSNTGTPFLLPYGPSGAPVDVPPAELLRQMAELAPGGNFPFDNSRLARQPAPAPQLQSQLRPPATKRSRSKDASVASKKQQQQQPTTPEPDAVSFPRQPSAGVMETVPVGGKTQAKDSRKPTVDSTRLAASTSFMTTSVLVPAATVELPRAPVADAALHHHKTPRKPTAATMPDLDMPTAPDDPVPTHHHKGSSRKATASTMPDLDMPTTPDDPAPPHHHKGPRKATAATMPDLDRPTAPDDLPVTHHHKSSRNPTAATVAGVMPTTPMDAVVPPHHHKGSRKPTAASDMDDQQQQQQQQQAVAGADEADDPAEVRPKGLRKSPSQAAAGSVPSGKRVRKTSGSQGGASAAVEGDVTGDGDELLQTVAVMARARSSSTKLSKSTRLTKPAKLKAASVSGAEERGDGGDGGDGGEGSGEKKVGKRKKHSV